MWDSTESHARNSGALTSNGLHGCARTPQTPPSHRICGEQAGSPRVNSAKPCGSDARQAVARVRSRDNIPRNRSLSGAAARAIAKAAGVPASARRGAPSRARGTGAGRGGMTIRVCARMAHATLRAAFLAGRRPETRPHRFQGRSRVHHPVEEPPRARTSRARGTRDHIVRIVAELLVPPAEPTRGPATSSTNFTLRRAGLALGG